MFALRPARLRAFNSYQSVIRGGHIWLKLRVGQDKVYSQGDHLNALIALNQDSIERHAPEVESGGAILFNADKLKVNIPIRDNVLTVPLPVAQLCKPFPPLAPVMQNTVALGALVFLLGMEFDVTADVLADTFKHKGKGVVDQNVGVAKAGYDYAREQFVPLGYKWKFTRKRRPFLTGNEAIAIGAVAAGCRFYSAYPMTLRFRHSHLDGRSRRALRRGRQADGRRVSGCQRSHRRRLCGNAAPCARPPAAVLP